MLPKSCVFTVFPFFYFYFFIVSVFLLILYPFKIICILPFIPFDVCVFFFVFLLLLSLFYLYITYHTSVSISLIMHPYPFLRGMNLISSHLLSIKVLAWNLYCMPFSMSRLVYGLISDLNFSQRTYFCFHETTKNYKLNYSSKQSLNFFQANETPNSYMYTFKIKLYNFQNSFENLILS